ncbi:MAG: 30S ribosomal protein S16 [uncultured bacterium]|nr:MAG: 30S ribosomal protein S16 [uncultured bacterium]
MSVTIRLARMGKKNAPTYKIVATNTRDKRNGKFLDILGFYNPIGSEVQSQIDTKKVEEWQSKGAMTSEAVKKILEGKYQYTKYSPKGDKTQEKTTEAPKEQLEKQVA